MSNLREKKVHYYAWRNMRIPLISDSQGQQVFPQVTRCILHHDQHVFIRMFSQFDVCFPDCSFARTGSAIHHPQETPSVHVILNNTQRYVGESW